MIAAVAVAVAACRGGAQAPGPAPRGPVVTIELADAGADAAVIEREAVEPVEQAIESLAGVRAIRSAIEPGRARVTIAFTAARPLELAAEDVRRALAEAARQLPERLAPPAVSLADPDGPALWLELAGPLPRVELSELARGAIRARLERLPGVGAVELEGAVERRIAIRPDLDRLAAANVTLPELLAAVSAAGLALPAGRIDASGRALRVAAPLAGIEDLGELAVGAGGPGGDAGEGVTLRLRDLAVIAEEAGPDPGGPIALGVRLHPGLVSAPGGSFGLDVLGRRSDARDEALAGVRAAAAELRRALPPQVTLTERALPPGQAAAPPLVAAVQGPDRAALRAIAARLADGLRASGAAAAVTVAPTPGRPEQTLQLDRARAAQLGVASATVAAMLRAALDGEAIGALYPAGPARPALEIVLRVDDAPADLLARATVRGTRGERIPLSALATVTASSSEALLRIDRSPAIELTVQLPPGGAPMAARARLTELARDLPPGYRVTAAP